MSDNKSDDPSDPAKRDFVNEELKALADNLTPEKIQEAQAFERMMDVLSDEKILDDLFDFEKKKSAAKISERFLMSAADDLTRNYATLENMRTLEEFQKDKILFEALQKRSLYASLAEAEPEESNLRANFNSQAQAAMLVYNDRLVKLIEGFVGTDQALQYISSYDRYNNAAVTLEKSGMTNLSRLIKQSYEQMTPQNFVELAKQAFQNSHWRSRDIVYIPKTIDNILEQSFIQIHGTSPVSAITVASKFEEIMSAARTLARLEAEKEGRSYELYEPYLKHVETDYIKLHEYRLGLNSASKTGSSPN